MGWENDLDGLTLLCDALFSNEDVKFLIQLSEGGSIWKDLTG
jgi:hypothetical protein